MNMLGTIYLAENQEIWCEKQRRQSLYPTYILQVEIHIESSIYSKFANHLSY